MLFLHILPVICTLLLAVIPSAHAHYLLSCPMVARRLPGLDTNTCLKPKRLPTPKLHIGGASGALGLRDHAWRYCRDARRYLCRKPGHGCANPCEMGRQARRW